MISFEKLQEMENSYINTQRPYLLEKTLLDELSSHNEVREFVTDIYTEYTALKKKLDKEYSHLINKYDQANEMTEYFIKLLVYTFSDNGERYSSLESTLNRVDKYIWNRKYKRKNKAYRDIDIHDIPISEVIGRYIKLPKSFNKNIKCMLHNDKTPSFRIYPKTNSWHCFGCKKGWNAIHFIAEIENCSTKEAFKIFINTYFNS